MSDVRRLEIGAGGVPHEGYEHNDLNPGPDIEHVGAAHTLDFPDSTLDEIYGCDVLEHMTYEESAAFLRRSIHWLKPGGMIDLTVPDMERWYVNLVRQDKEKSWVMCNFHGWNRFPGDVHQSFWSPQMLVGGLEAVGYTNIHIYQTWICSSTLDWHICVKGYRTSRTFILPQVVDPRSAENGW